MIHNFMWCVAMLNIQILLYLKLRIFQPPIVKCLTKLWHPNISEDGDVCLSILRQSSIDGLGWAPTRKLKDVVWGLNSLFTVCIQVFPAAFNVVNI